MATSIYKCILCTDYRLSHDTEKHIIYLLSPVYTTPWQILALSRKLFPRVLFLHTLYNACAKTLSGLFDRNFFNNSSGLECAHACLDNCTFPRFGCVVGYLYVLFPAVTISNVFTRMYILIPYIYLYLYRMSTVLVPFYITNVCEMDRHSETSCISFYR